MGKGSENNINMEDLVGREPFIEESVLAVLEPSFGNTICTGIRCELRVQMVERRGLLD